MIGWAFLSAGTALVAAPLIAEAFRPRVTNKQRAAATGQVADLPNGPTWFQWRGPEGGPVAVCVHGLTTPSFVWGPLADHLSGMGFRVLTYDLYGRGLSARPKGEQVSTFFTAQLAALLDHQGIEGDFTLLGYSMGGAIATGFAAAHPDRVCQLCLIAPAGLGHDLGPVAQMAINHPNIGKWMMLGFYPRSLRRGLNSERSLPSAIPDMVDLQIAESRKHGFAPAVLSSLRGIMDEDLAPAHRAICDAGIPTLAIWGETDDVIPLAGRDRLAALNPAARNVVIPGAGHTLAYTHVAEVSEVMDTLHVAKGVAP
ncbi:alpha/beta hydrolase [Roseovarius sp. SK2]|uniref:alpha/beta fold hydrolase n=1 Tax=Roseovarius sp. SK2 TaxID=3028381 RepID=UPI00237C24DA|nr:alpha/beta hydrolase [Roseovarius sp. SK2]MDD9725434.1 alpha/beta hydrolase [Roseovarius sp. SK2]